MTLQERRKPRALREIRKIESQRRAPLLHTPDSRSQAPYR